MSEEKVGWNDKCPSVNVRADIVKESLGFKRVNHIKIITGKTIGWINFHREGVKQYANDYLAKRIVSKINAPDPIGVIEEMEKMATDLRSPQSSPYFSYCSRTLSELKRRLTEGK